MRRLLPTVGAWLTRATALSGAALLVVALFGVGPVAAQDDAEPAQTPTTQTPTTQAPIASTPTTQAPSSEPSAEPATTQDPNLDSSTSEPAEVTSSTEFNPDDPGASEGPAETVPDVALTVPPATYRAAEEGTNGMGQAQERSAFAPSQVLVSNVAAARVKLGEAEESRLLAVASVKSLRLRSKELALEAKSLRADLRSNLRLSEEAQQRLRLRASAAFVVGDSFVGGLNHDDMLDAERQQSLVESVFVADRAEMAELEAEQARIEQQLAAANERFALIGEMAKGALQSVARSDEAIAQAERELVVFEAGSSIYIEGAVFPVAEPFKTPLVDSWGFLRMAGTPDAHGHVGIDLFAPEGTPLLAAERGILTRVGVGRLGGLKLWLRGESGTDWYYAHMSAFVSGLAEGDVVEVGQVIGFVGTTGNAVGTPPHLHLQIHPNGGNPVNPYPLMDALAAAVAEP